MIMVSIEDPMAESIRTRPYARNVASDSSFSYALESIQNCVQRHEICSSRKKDLKLPTRVIDVGNGDNIKLYISNPGEQEKYAALSYCWGAPPGGGLPAQPVMNTLETISRLVSGITYQSLPQTIKDAIICTRKLGLRYLWIDVLCIIQDDSIDKSREISCMKDIFSNAHVVISAASAQDCYSGFLQDRSHHNMKTSFYIPYRGRDGRLGNLFLELTPPDKLIADAFEWKIEPINRRAWVSSLLT